MWCLFRDDKIFRPSSVKVLFGLLTLWKKREIEFCLLYDSNNLSYESVSFELPAAWEEEAGAAVTISVQEKFVVMGSKFLSIFANFVKYANILLSKVPPKTPHSKS